MSWSAVTAEHVRRAIAECDELGHVAFRLKYGFGEALRYDLVEGHRYDSKAILGVAYIFANGERPRHYSGGADTVVPRLQRLGFTVEDRHVSESVPASPNGPLDWTRDEDILALDLFVRAGSLNGGPLPGKADRRVVELSSQLQSLPVYPRSRRGLKFRNPDGVALKLANFRAVERAVKLANGVPESEGLPLGMPSSSSVDREVFEAFFERNFLGLAEAAQAVLATTTQYEDAVSAVVAESCPVESAVKASYETTGSAGGTRNREEHTLVARYTAWLAGMGVKSVARLYRVPTLALPLRCDVFLPGKNVLIEAKSSHSRESVRMAIGQLFDYRRYEETEPDLAVLVPSLPNNDIRDLLASLGIAWIWPYGSGFRDSAKGRYTAA